MIAIAIAIACRDLAPSPWILHHHHDRSIHRSIDLLLQQQMQATV
jgi:hypothetical protein